MAFDIQAPEIHLSHPAIEFIDNRLDGDFHPAFNDDSHIDYSIELDKYVVQSENPVLFPKTSREIKKTKEIDDQEQCLKQAITEYVSHLKSKEKSKLTIDYEKTCCTWDDVIGAMKTARDRYDGKEIKGFCLTRTIRNGFRKFGSLKASIESWLRLLPRDSLYGSLLCGGLEIIFSVRDPPLAVLKLMLTQMRLHGRWERCARTHTMHLSRYQLLSAKPKVCHANIPSSCFNPTFLSYTLPYLTLYNIFFRGIRGTRD
jgi:hypothetical protein